MDEQELQIQSAPPLKRPRVLMACQRCKAKKTKVGLVDYCTYIAEPIEQCAISATGVILHAQAVNEPDPVSGINNYDSTMLM
jgi:hypothetical protein